MSSRSAHRSVWKARWHFQLPERTANALLYTELSFEVALFAFPFARAFATSIAEHIADAKYTEKLVRQQLNFWKYDCKGIDLLQISKQIY
jgi:hypothetical protein